MGDKDHLVVDMNGGDNLKRSDTQGSFGKGLRRSDSFVEEERHHRKRHHDILACLEEGTEGCITLVGSIDDIDRPVVAFVRMAEAIALPNTIEVSLPVRFVIIILTPTMDMEYDAHEIGRSISTLMSNQAFHNVCYNAQEKRDLLHGINEFLGDSVVLPPGDWDKAHLLHMGEMIDMKNKMKARKATLIHQQSMPEGAKPAAAGAPGGGDGGDDKNPEKDSKGPRNPLKRTTTLVRFFTKFTKDIFASLVSLLFIFEAFNKLVKIFRAHPLQETYDYCSHLPDHCHAFNDTSFNETRLSCTAEKILETKPTPQPNTALMSMILMFGTFFIAYFLRLFRNSQYLGRNARRALGDFGVPIAIVIMVLVDWSAGDTFTEKLKVPEGIAVTD